MEESTEKLTERQVKDIWKKIATVCANTISDHTVMDPDIGIGTYEGAVAQGYDVRALANWYSKFSIMFSKVQGIAVYQEQEYIGTIKTFSSDCNEIAMFALCQWLSYNNVNKRGDINNEARVIKTMVGSADIKYVLAYSIEEGEDYYFYTIYHIKLDYIDLNDEHKTIVVDFPAGFSLEGFINSLGPDMTYCNLDSYIRNKDDFIIWDGTAFMSDMMDTLDVDKVGEYVKKHLDVPEDIITLITPYLDSMMEEELY